MNFFVKIWNLLLRTGKVWRMEKPPIMKVLQDAQLAHEAGDFVNALKFYAQFFDHALDDDPYALYGVRLSYCLDGWARLAKEFVGAKNQLIEKQVEAIQEYQEKKRPESFHDYYAISCALDDQQSALDMFLAINSKSNENASKLVKFVWQDLINREQWQVCNQFLDDPVQKLDECFSVFEEANRLQDMDISFATDSFQKHIISELVEGINELLMVLRHNNRVNDVDMIQRKFYEIAHANNHAGLERLLQSKGAFLFSGH